MRHTLGLVIVLLFILLMGMVVSTVVLAAGGLLSRVFPLSIAEAAIIVLAGTATAVWILQNTLTPLLRDPFGNVIEEDDVEADDVEYKKDGTPICPQCGREMTPAGPARWTHKERGDEDVPASAPVGARKNAKKGRR